MPAASFTSKTQPLAIGEGEAITAQKLLISSDMSVRKGTCAPGNPEGQPRPSLLIAILLYLLLNFVVVPLICAVGLILVVISIPLFFIRPSLAEKLEKVNHDLLLLASRIVG